MITTVNRCLALYSGGLDSILAVKLIQEQGIDVIPLYFYTPFFGFSVMRDPESFLKKHEEKFKIKPHLIDYTNDMIEIIHNPRHGYGKNLNPCIDCKIGMMKRAKELLEPMGASFVITGEVLMQRPMSQRRQVMRNIEKEAGLTDLLLRPLSARKLEETYPERTGLVKREDLWNLQGRGRTIQIEHVQEYGIRKEDIPSPAGGCLLTDERIAKKVRNTFKRCSPAFPEKEDIMLDVVGRKFVLYDSTILVVSRNEEENGILSMMKFNGNVFLSIDEVPGPLCILRGQVTDEILSLAAGICLRYGKARGKPGQKAVYGDDPDNMGAAVDAPVFTDEYCLSFMQL
jgi:tRNA-uridine 2-sulfurtransferase